MVGECWAWRNLQLISDAHENISVLLIHSPLFVCGLLSLSLSFPLFLFISHSFVSRLSLTEVWPVSSKKLTMKKINQPSNFYYYLSSSLLSAVCSKLTCRWGLLTKCKILLTPTDLNSSNESSSLMKITEKLPLLQRIVGVEGRNSNTRRFKQEIYNLIVSSELNSLIRNFLIDIVIDLIHFLSSRCLSKNAREWA